MSSSDTSPGVYPGNPSLPPEVREKILSTFRHTLNLYKEGKLDDCLIGCDFILKMDARFAPARKLLEKAKNPGAAVDVADLEALVAGTLTRQERVVAAEPDRLLVRAVESYNARDFDAAARAAEQVLQVLPGNQDAVEILEKAHRKKAAQPQVEAFKEKAIAALGANRLDDARIELERMKALDPDHPAVALLEPKLGAKAPRAAPAVPAMPPLDTAFGQDASEPHIAFDDHATMAIRLDELPPPVQPVKAPADLSDTSPLKPRRRPPAEPAVPPPPPPLRSAPATENGLDALSLDSLSLDMPASPGPAAPPSVETPGPPPGSPADMWGEPPAGMELKPLAGPSVDEPHPMPGAEPSFDLSSSFEAPPAPPEPAAGPELKPIQETELSPSERDIANLLKQGDDAAKRGDRQQAIEIWSRIFLIDINNSEAVIRIERSRQDMAEGNRKIADCLKTGREAFEAGDLAVAREMFLQVLAVDENEPTAKFYLDRIEEELAAPASEPSAPEAAEPSAPAEPAAAAREAGAPAPARGLRFPFPPRILGPIAIFLLLAGGGAWYVMRQPGPRNAPPTLAPTKARIDDAATLVRDGKTKEAIAMLNSIPPTDPEYARAKKMIDQLSRQLPSETPGVSAAATTPAPGAPDVSAPAAPAEPAQLRAAAEKALAEKRYIEALKGFNLALPSYRSDPTFSQGMGSAAEKVTEISPAVRLFNEREYETAIPLLWRIFQEDRENRDARSYLLRCYYNQGVSQLQNSLFSKALKSFDEVLALDPKDAEARRHRRFAERYQKADMDLMGRIYVRHVPQRP